MKKTLNINLSGLVFTIDEDAYKELKNYLDTLRQHFNTSEGSDEIMDDIEERVAELMQEKLTETKLVINSTDIQDIVAQMGSPEDYMEESAFDEEETRSSYTYSNSKSQGKKFYRDGDNAILGGVCAGIAHYFGVQPLWVRLALIIAFLTWGFGFLIYIILWVIVPKAKTTAEKLEMTGEPVNVSNIGKRVEEELKGVNEKLKNEGTINSIGSALGNFIERVGSLIMRLLTLVFKAFGKILGAFLLFIGSIMTISLIITFIAMVSAGSFINIGGESAYSFHEISNLVFPSQFDAYFLLIGGFLISVIPVLAILYGGISLVSRYKSIPKGLGWGLAGTWLLGMIIVAYGGISIGNDFSKPGNVQETQSIEHQGDTLFLTLNEKALKDLNGNIQHGNLNTDFYYDQQNGVVSIDEVELNIEKSNTDQFMLIEDKSARGNSFDKAQSRAEGIMYEFNESENTLSFNPIISFQSVDKWRAQNVQLTLLVPVGKTVYLEKNLKHFIYDVDNITNTYDKYMVGHYWTMTPNGLQSPDFIKNDLDEDEETGIEEIEITVDSAQVSIKM